MTPASETGEHDQIVNAPLRAGDGGDAFRDAFETAILPRLDDFAPDLLIISAGFDAHFRDPLGGLNLQRGRLRLGDRAPRRAGRPALRRPASSRCSRAATTSKASARSAAAHVGALMRG